MDKQQAPAHPVVILIRGLPGSGKTYLAMALQEELGRAQVIMLDPDTTDYTGKAYAEHTKALSAEGVDVALHPYRFLRAQAYAGIAAHKVIIWNQPFTNLEIFHKMVANLRREASEHSTSLGLLVVEVEIDPTVAKKRVGQRKQAGGHGPSDNTFARRVSDYASLAGQGYAVVSVRGEDDISVSLSAVMEALQHLRSEA